MQTKEDKILFYVINTWYQSKCKNKVDIQRIVHEELHKNPDGGIVEVGVKAKRRCMNEL